MGRKHRHKHRHSMHQQRSVPIMTGEEETLLALADSLDLRIPHQLNCWRRFFLDRDSYISALKGWVEAQVQCKGHVRVIDDVDRGFMKPRSVYGNEPERGSTLNSGKPDASSPWSGWEEWAEYQDGGYGYPQPAHNQHSRVIGYHNAWRGSALPLTPKIDAPSGCSVTEGETPHHIL